MASTSTLCSCFGNSLVSTISPITWTGTHGSRTRESVSAEIAAHLDPTSGIDKTWRRNASLAWVEFTIKSSSAPFATASSEADVEKYPRVTAIIKYLQDFGDAPTAYSDLTTYVELLQNEERSKLLEILKNGLQFDKTAKKNDLNTMFKALSISTSKVSHASQPQLA